MRKTIFTALVAVVVSLLCAVTASPAVGAPGTVLFAGGTSGSLGELVPDGYFGDQSTLLGGAYSAYDFRGLDYPAALWPITGPFDATLGASVEIGTESLTQLALSTAGPLVIAGTSQGAMVVQNTAQSLNGNPAVASDTTFIMIADPNFGIFRARHGMRIPVLNYVPQPAPQTRFTTIIVVNEYDAFADPMTGRRNPLAVANAVMSVIYVHPYAQNADLSQVPPENITVTTNSQGGTTTTYLVPTARLPLTMPLRQLHVPAAAVDRIDASLRPVIDTAYARNSPPPASNRSRAEGRSSTPGAGTPVRQRAAASA